MGPAPHHYQCYTVYAPATHAERIMKKVEFFPHNFPVPKISSTDATRQLVEYLTEVLHNPSPETPFAVGDEKM